jgi:hypothetical protein
MGRKVVAEHPLRFFAFDLDAPDGAEADLEDGLTRFGFDVADMRHLCRAGITCRGRYEQGAPR